MKILLSEFSIGVKTTQDQSHIFFDMFCAYQCVGWNIGSWDSTNVSLQCPTEQKPFGIFDGNETKFCSFGQIWRLESIASGPHISLVCMQC